MPAKPELQALPKRPPNDRGQGRKALPPEERTVVKSVRLKPLQWAMYEEMGGPEWLRNAVEAAYTRFKRQGSE